MGNGETLMILLLGAAFISKARNLVAKEPNSSPLTIDDRLETLIKHSSKNPNIVWNSRLKP